MTQLSSFDNFPPALIVNIGSFFVSKPATSEKLGVLPDVSLSKTEKSLNKH